MLLDKNQLKDYLEEINQLNKEYLNEVIDRVNYFAVIEDSKLLAAASVKCFSGHWYLRSCFVKPEYRGKGLQRKLIQERIEYLKSKTDVVKISVKPTNKYSLDNIKAEGFEFFTEEILKNGILVHKYKKIINP
ncbi:GNAT family N-acetyltransferase [archaeon]|nr:GNAT family N-acetyltransferase [archaeon]